MKTLTIYLLGRVLVNLSKSNTVHYEVTKNFMNTVLSTILYLQYRSFSEVEALANQKENLLKDIRLASKRLEELTRQVKDAEEVTE